MFVCKECYEKDKHTISASVLYEDNPQAAKAECSVCGGEPKLLRWCNDYTRYRHDIKHDKR